MNQGGDVLARGGKSANFAGAATVTQFEDDLIFRLEEVEEKYGLTQEEVDRYEAARLNGEEIPNIPSVAEKNAALKVTVTDRRTAYLENSALGATNPVAETPKKFPVPQFDMPQTILDRVLVMRVPENSDFEILEDGSARNKRSGLIVAAKYRQHSNTGIILLIGRSVNVGGVSTPMWEIVNPGDRVTFGDYNSEVYPLDPKKAEELCDKIGVNYETDSQGIRIVRVQDIRLVERRLTKVPHVKVRAIESPLPNDKAYCPERIL